MIRAYRRWRIRRLDAQAAAVLAEVEALESCGAVNVWARERNLSASYQSLFAGYIGRATYHRRMLGVEVPSARVVPGDHVVG